jgi:phage I-like protein
VLQLLGASLTNDPGLDGLTDLAALAAQYLIQRQPPETPMNETLKKLLAALGVAESADEAVALAAVQALKTNVAALSAQVAQPDPARYVPIAALSALQAEHVGLQNKFAALSAQVHTAALEQVIADGLAAGKLTPALEPWARQLGGKDLAALSAYIAAAPAGIVPGATQTGGQSPTGQAGVAALSAEEQKVCSMLGVLPADYLKTKAA